MSVVNEAALSKYTHNERRTMKVAKKISENREPREGPKNAKLFLLFTPKKYTHIPKWERRIFLSDLHTYVYALHQIIIKKKLENRKEK